MSTYVVAEWHAFGRSIEEFTVSVETVRVSNIIAIIIIIIIIIIVAMSIVHLLYCLYLRGGLKCAPNQIHEP